MNIGEEKPAIVVEPVPQEIGVPEIVPEPVTVPADEPEEVPA